MYKRLKTPAMSVSGGGGQPKKSLQHLTFDKYIDNITNMCSIIKKGFTLAEVLMVMLILSIIMAAFAPMMTTRNKVDLGSPWKYAENNSDIYYGLGAKQTAIIGQKELKSSDPKSRLIVAIKDLVEWPYTNHINLKRGNMTASLGVSGSGSLIFGQSAIGGSYNVSEFNIPEQQSNLQAIAIGANSLYSADEAYADHIAIGSYSLYQNNSMGGNNIAIGHYASLGTQSSDNISLGTRALSGNENGYGNIGIGTNALISAEDYNNDIHLVPNFNTYDSGDYNVAIGYYSMPSSHKGSNNVAIGANAFEGSMEGNPIENSVAIGYNACKNMQGPNRICIGANSGGNNPYEDTVGELIYIGSRSAYNGADAPLFIVNNNIDGAIALNHHTSVAGDLYVKGAAYNPSDKRLKNISGKNKIGLEKLRELTVYNFTFKDDKTKTPRIGLIAQDVQKVLPEAVDKNKDGFLKLKQENITYLMFNAIKQLDTLVQGIINELKILEAQRTEIIQLKKQNAELEKRIERLEAKIK